MLKGINYDIGSFICKQSSKEMFNPAILKREMEIIKNDLHCDCVRITGNDIKSLYTASKFALQQGLEVWLSPEFIDAAEDATLEYLRESALAAQELLSLSTNIVFVLGTELTVKMKGFITGQNPLERRIGSVKFTKKRQFKLFLLNVVSIIRENYDGRIAYVAGFNESIDWNLFDFIGINLSNQNLNSNTFQEDLEKYLVYNKPVLVLGFRCGKIRESGFGELFEQDEKNWGTSLIDLMIAFDRKHLEGAFLFTFDTPPIGSPDFDQDMFSCSLVKPTTGITVGTYKDLPWEPNRSFFDLARYYSEVWF